MQMTVTSGYKFNKGLEGQPNHTDIVREFHWRKQEFTVSLVFLVMFTS